MLEERLNGLRDNTPMSHKIEMIEQALTNAINIVLAKEFESVGLASCISTTISKDLRFAHAYISVIDRQAFEKSLPEIKSQIGQELKKIAKIRYVPKIEFIWDENYLQEPDILNKI